MSPPQALQNDENIGGRTGEIRRPPVSGDSGVRSSGNYDTLISIYDTKKRIKPNGAIYINKTKEFLKHRTLFRNKKTTFYRMPKIRSVDIDRIQDFNKALKFSTI